MVHQWESYDCGQLGFNVTGDLWKVYTYLTLVPFEGQKLRIFIIQFSSVINWRMPLEGGSLYIPTFLTFPTMAKPIRQSPQLHPSRQPSSRMGSLRGYGQYRRESTSNLEDMPIISIKTVPCKSWPDLLSWLWFLPPLCQHCLLLFYFW